MYGIIVMGIVGENNFFCVEEKCEVLVVIVEVVVGWVLVIMGVFELMIELVVDYVKVAE